MMIASLISLFARKHDADLPIDKRVEDAAGQACLAASLRRWGRFISGANDDNTNTNTIARTRARDAHAAAGKKLAVQWQ